MFLQCFYDQPPNLKIYLIVWPSGVNFGTVGGLYYPHRAVYICRTNKCIHTDIHLCPARGPVRAAQCARPNCTRPSARSPVCAVQCTPPKLRAAQIARSPVRASQCAQPKLRAAQCAQPSARRPVREAQCARPSAHSRELKLPSPRVGST